VAEQTAAGDPAGVVPNEGSFFQRYGAILMVAAAIAVVAIAGIAAIIQFGHRERARDLQGWYLRLATISDGRAVAVSRWLESQFTPLARIADNQAVQLYATEILDSSDPQMEAMAEAAYLRNLLIVTAQQNGFSGPSVGPAVPANVQRLGVAGIAILSMDGKPIVSTPEMPPFDDEWKKFVTSIPRGERRLRDLYPSASGAPAMAFAAPLYRVQGNNKPSEQIGIILGIKEVGDELYPLLKEPQTQIPSEEALLVRKMGDLVEYISPLGGDVKPFTRRQSFEPDNEAGSFVIGAPGASALRLDHRNIEVLVTGRSIALAPWFLVEKVDRAVALADSEAGTLRLTIFLTLGLLAVVAILGGIWRHGASVRARRATDLYRAVADRLQKQEALLALVTDTVPDEIFLADRQGHLTFINQAGAKRLGAAKDELRGKTLAGAFGPVEAKRHERRGQDAIDANDMLSQTDKREEGAGQETVQTRYIPLAAGGAAATDSFLVVETDITEVVAAREKQARTMRQLVDALVHIVEQRDATGVRHAERVASVAAALAREMNLEPVLVETVAITARLANFGKVLLPEGLLTKAGALDQEEKDLINRVHLMSADFLSGIEFDGPVNETLRQIQERYDGTGTPKGMKGDDILMTAQIIAVANSFVAMLSDRPYRKRLPLDKAMGILLSQSGSVYNPKVVMALGNYIENHGGRAEWSEDASG
jgi:PAS domain S-box-containing protein